MQHISLLAVDKTLSPFQVAIESSSNANVHCGIDPSQNEDWENCQSRVLNHYSNIHPDCIQERTAEERKFRFHPYAFLSIHSPSLNGVLSDCPKPKTLFYLNHESTFS